MKATEAREKTLKHVSDLRSNELNKVYKQIESSTQKGDFETYYYGKLSKHTRDSLSEYGYSVSDCTDPRDRESTYKIKW